MDQNSDDLIQKITEDDDPNRCQAIGKSGQCHNVAVPHGTTCKLHGGNRVADSLRNKAVKNYALDKWRAKISRHTSSQRVLSLRDELGMSRMLLEEMFEMCNGAQDLMQYSQKILFMIQNIERLVMNCQKLEKSLGEHLSKDELATFTAKILQIIQQEIKPERMDEVAKKILEAAGIKLDEK